MSKFIKLDTQFGKYDDENDDPEKHKNFKHHARKTPITERIPIHVRKSLSDVGQELRKHTRTHCQTNEKLQNHLNKTLAYYNMQLHDAKYDKSYNEKDIRNNLKNDLKKIINSASDNEQRLHLNKRVLNSKYADTPAYEIASKLLDTELERNGISRDLNENVLGGSYKTRRIPLPKKSRRSKKRKTNSTKKRRK